MKTSITYLLFLTVLFFSCGQQKENKDNIAFVNDYDNSIRNDNLLAQSHQNQDNIKYFESVDQSTGLISSRYPFPSNWKKSKKPGVIYEGPNSIRMSGSTTSSFQFTNNQEIAWTWQQHGIQNVPPLSLNQIIEQFYLPIARETGRTLSKTYSLPELAKTMTLFHNQLFVSVPTQRDIKAYGLEWTDKNGLSYISTLILSIAYSQASSSWSFTGQYLEAPHSHFEKAKKAFMYGLTNVITNPKWVMTCNQRDAKRAGVQLQAHLGRLAIINARGNTSKSVGAIYSEISDISHAGYLKRNDINNNGHSKTINMINERTLIGNHDTGEHYNVPSGSNYYWVNNDGKFIATNNSLYDPRIDNRISNTDWIQFKKEN